MTWERVEGHKVNNVHVHCYEQCHNGIEDAVVQIIDETNMNKSTENPLGYTN